MYDMRVAVTDDGTPPFGTNASSLLNVANEPLLLRSSDDTDGDGVSDVAEGPADSDGDRVAEYLDNIANANMLRLAADGRILETKPGLGLRLGARTFARGSAYASIKEQDVSTDADYGYASEVPDFEITTLDQGTSAQIVIPLANPVSAGAVYRVYAGGQWRNFIEDAGNRIDSAPGGKGACPPPANPAYRPGMTVPYGCLQLALTDGGPNDSDGVADGVIRITGGLAAPVSARGQTMQQVNTALAGDGEAIMVRTRLHSDSGDALMNSLTLQATGAADERQIDDVILINDTNRDGKWDDDDILLAQDKFAVDDGMLTLFLDKPFEVPAGDTDLLVVYVFGAVE